MESKNLLTVKEATAYLGITKQRLYRLMSLKRIVYVRYFKFAYFDKSELDKFKSENFKIVEAN